MTATRSTGDFVLYRPRHNLRIVGIVGSIGKISLANRRGAFSRFPHISHCHDAATVYICAEGETGHQALFSGPQSGLVEVVGGFNKGFSCCRIWGAVSAPRVGQNLSLTASCAQRGCGLVGANSDTLVYHPLYRIRTAVAGPDIGKTRENS